MSCYISSNNNRLYAGRESSYGQVPAVTWHNRIPTVKMSAHQVPVQTERRDKTGSRTFVGIPNSIRKQTSYELSTFLTAWSDPTAQPSYGPLFEAGLGRAPVFASGGTVASANGNGITFSSPHELGVGQAVAAQGEIRFVAAIQDETTVFVNAPFTQGLAVGTVTGPTVTYRLADDLPSVSIFDYWDPASAVQRIVNGAAVDRLRVRVNGDFQEFQFAGPARDIIDSGTFASGEGSLTQFPTEPVDGGFDYTIVPGHLGQVWMGATPTQFLTLTAAELTVHNGIDLRAREFGSDLPQCISGGQRGVSLDFSLFERVDTQTTGLYQAARQRSPIGVMLQLGQQSGQLFGAYMPAVVPEVPDFDETETRMQWRFKSNRAQGTVNNELYVAFG
jgi:hypothetical protein